MEEELTIWLYMFAFITIFGMLFFVVTDTPKDLWVNEEEDDQDN